MENSLISVPSCSTDTSTRVTCSGQEESVARRKVFKEATGVVEQGAVIVEIDRAIFQHAFGLRLPSAPLTEQAQNQH